MAQKSFQRPVVKTLTETLQGHPDILHVIVGPRQVGKTTAALQIEKKWSGETHFAAADQMLPPSAAWIETQWVMARKKAASSQTPLLLILDEIQKIPGWSEVVKAHLDEDRRNHTKIVPLVLGSSSLLLQKGLSESLSGRFFLHRFPHWTFAECKKAFGWDLDQWLFFGGYPGGERFIANETLWKNYIADSLVETAITRDIVQMQPINKPTLLRHLFAFATQLPAQILSYNKMLGQLQDAGNTTTLAHYLRLLASAFLLSGLEQYRGGVRTKRGSSPKLILWNNGLISAFSSYGFDEAKQDPAYWGRLIENAVGAHLLNHLQGSRFEVFYWRERNEEVDFVVNIGRTVWAIEVKSGRQGRLQGLERFRERHPKVKVLIIGSEGMPIKEFFETDPLDILK